MKITLAAFDDAAKSARGLTAEAGVVFKTIPYPVRAIFATLGVLSLMSSGQSTEAIPSDPNIDGNGYPVLDAKILFGRDTVAPPMRIVVEPATPVASL